MNSGERVEKRNGQRFQIAVSKPGHQKQADIVDKYFLISRKKAGAEFPDETSSIIVITLKNNSNLTSCTAQV